MKVHEVTNRLARNALTREERGVFIRQLTPQMRNGYRLAFPILRSNGNVLLSITLLARADDRLSGFPLSLTGKPIQPVADADHVFVLLCFEQEAQWLEQAEKVKAVYPEQPEAEELVMDFTSDHANDPSRPSTLNVVAGVEGWRKAVTECFEDAARAGLVDPIVCCLDTSDEMARELAMNHVTSVLSRLKAKILDARTGELRPVEPVGFGGEVAVQAWPPDLLLATMREMGAPQPFLDAMARQLSRLPTDHFWMLGWGTEQPLLAPMPKPVH